MIVGPASAAVIDVDGTSGPQLLGAAVQVIPDPDAGFLAEDVLAGRYDASALSFRRSPPNLGYPQHPYWAVLDLENSGAHPVTQLLVLWRGSTHRQRAYWRSTDNTSLGPIQESAVNDIESRHAVLRLRLPARGRLRVAIRIDTATSLSLDYRLMTAEQLARVDRIDYWFFGLLSGVISAIAIYVFALYLALRERLYLCFAGFALCNIVYQLHTEGYAYLLWPVDLRTFGNGVSSYSGTLFSLLIVQFVRDYLRLVDTQPRVDRWLVRPVIWLQIPVFFLFPFWPWVANSLIAFGLVLGIFVLVTVVLRAAFRNPPVWSFVIGILFFFASTFVYLLKRVAVLPDAQILSLVLQLGSAVTMITFAIAVIERVRRIVAENRAAQQRYAERLELDVRERTAQLSQAKEHAEQSLAKLQAAQRQLVQAEKMASLGQLVAGVAHEVNTPLGVALTASSFLEDRAHSVTHRLDSGQLGERELRGFLGETENSTGMIRRNLDRAAHLISSFKQVSVDRTSDGRRSFLMSTCIEDLIESLKLTWKRRPITLTAECPEQLELNSFPGTLGQVLTNLIQNALLHAFEPDQSGAMQIKVRELDANAIELVFHDNGKGVDASELGKIFEPFYTTKRNQGGTGLGLHVTFNLVVQKLGGTVAAASTPGAGMTFTLRLPKTAPEQA